MKCLRIGVMILSTAILCIVHPAGALDPVRDVTGRTLKQHFENKTTKAKIATKRFIRDPVGYLAQLPESIVSDVCSAPTQYYEKTLQAEAKDKWKALPQLFIDVAQGAYSVNLSGIKYAEDINTLDGSAQTFGNRIYFPRKIDFRKYNDLHWMLHELEHTVQYSRAPYGKAGKLCEYSAKFMGAGFDHDRIDMEQAADRKADRAIEYVFWVMNNGWPQGLKSNDSLHANQILIFNDTDIDVFFVMATAYTARGQERVPAHSWTLFNAAPDDTWFNVDIGTRVQSGKVLWIRYGLDGGSRQHINWNKDGLLDFFTE